MAQRATWRERLDDPRTPLGWAAADLGGVGRLVARQSAWALAAASALALGQGDWFGGLCAAAFVGVPGAVVRGLGSLRGMADLPGAVKLTPRSLPVRELLTIPPPATPYPCRVEVDRNGTLLGEDLAVVTFLDGWLHVEGRRTSFALRRPDVSRLADGRLELAEGGGIRFAPQDWLVAGGLTETNLAARFRADLASWMRSDAPEGEGVLPPATAHPSGAARAWEGLAVSLLFGAAFAALLAGTPTGWVMVVPFGLGALRAVADLRRVRRLRRMGRPPLPAGGSA